MQAWKAWRKPINHLCKKSIPFTCSTNDRGELGLDELQNSLDSLFQDCNFKKKPAAVKHLHLLLASDGFDTIPICTDHLIRLFALSDSVCDAWRAFTRVSKPSLYTWNAIISASVALGTSGATFVLYHSMLQGCFLPDRVMLLSLLKACDTAQSMLLHHHIASYGFDTDILISSALVDVHAKNGALKEAYTLFKQTRKRDVVSWGVLMSGYLQHGYFFRVLDLFEKMQLEDVDPDRVIILCILKACSHVGALAAGRLIHCEVLRTGLEADLAIGNTVIDMYARCGSVDEAYRILERLQKRDAVSWSALFAGYAVHGFDILVFKKFRTMQDEGLKPSKVTYLCLLKACMNIASMTQGWLIHDCIVKNAYDSDLEVGNSLVDFYAKCGFVDEAYRVFSRLTKHDIVTWGALLAGYAQVCTYESVMYLLNKMKRQGLVPNNIIFTSIFAACSRAGRIKEAQLYFEDMVVSHKIMPSVENYSCLIDLFGRAGSLEQAQYFFEILPLQLDVVTWKSLLTSCKTHGSIHLGQHCFDQAVHLDDQDATNYVQIARLYADAHLNEDASKFQLRRRSAEAWKVPGKAWLEVDEELFEFVVGNREHDEGGELDGKFSRLCKVLKGEGHVPRLDVTA